MRRAVIALASTRPVWRIPRPSAATIRRAFGPGWTVHEVRTPVSSDGDGGAVSPAARRAVRGAEVYLGWGVPPGLVEAAGPALRWVHSAAAGVGSALTPALRTSGVLFTNARGVQAESMADWALAAILFCSRGFHWAVQAQHERRWAKEAFTDGTVPLTESRDLRVGIVGLGGAGRAIARRCAALGMQVRGIRRRPGRRRPAGVSWVGGPGDLRALARQSDILVLAAPHTADTRGLVDARALRALPPNAYVINLGRGALLDERALLDELEGGRIAGCVLDVLAAEPLPADHPLWCHPRAFLTPHVSGVSTHFWQRATTLMVDNIRRYRAGRRLRNLVDIDAGY